MALEAGGGDSLTRQTMGQRAWRPAAADVRSGVDRGDGTVGTMEVSVVGSLPAATDTLEAGGGDSLSRQTFGQRAMRPAVSDVRSGVDRGDGELGTLEIAVYPAASSVYYGVAYGPTGTEYEGTLLTPTANPTTDTAFDTEFGSMLGDMFDTDYFAVDIEYYSEQAGIDSAIPAVAIFLYEGDKQTARIHAEQRDRNVEVWVKSTTIAEPRPSRDYLVHDGVTYIVMDVGDHVGTAWQLFAQAQANVQLTGRVYDG